MVSDAQALDRLARDADAVDAAKVQRMFDAAPRMLAALRDLSILCSDMIAMSDDEHPDFADSAADVVDRLWEGVDSIGEAECLLAELLEVSTVDGDRACKCDGCDGSGVRPDSTDHAGEPPAGFVSVERCDSCQKFRDDLEAAKAWGLDARWMGGNGTETAIARPKA